MMKGVWSMLFQQKTKQSMVTQAVMHKLEPATVKSPAQKNVECPGCHEDFSNHGGLTRHLQSNPTHDHYTKSNCSVSIFHTPGIAVKNTLI